MYTLAITYDSVCGEWSLLLSKKWWIFSIPQALIVTNEYYEHNKDYKRWVYELNPEIIIINK